MIERLAMSLIALGLAGAGVPALGEGEPGNGLLTMDFNGDRGVDLLEYRTGMDRLYKGADIDGNGYIDSTDYRIIMIEGDTDKDLWLSHTEYRKYIDAFNEKDGQFGLSQDEIDDLVIPTHPEVIKQLLACCDTDGDVRVTRTEFDRLSERFFIDLDWDRDTKLLPGELNNLLLEGQFSAQ